MAKPIAVLYLPRNDYYSISISELTSAFNGYNEKIKMPDAFSDYLWFIFENGELIAPELRVFHEKDFTSLQYNELEVIIKNGVKQFQNIDGK